MFSSSLLSHYDLVFPPLYCSLDLSKPVQPCTLSVLSQACQQWGFFNITTHGTIGDLFNKICLHSKHLFGLPSDCKLKPGLSSSIQTYTHPFISLPFFECLRICGPEFYASAKSYADVLLGQKSSEFRSVGFLSSSLFPSRIIYICSLFSSEVFQEYGRKMEELAKKILEITLLCLGDGYDKFHGFLRIVKYYGQQEIEKDIVSLPLLLLKINMYSQIL